MTLLNPIISVLMPVYNGERFIKESIESILSQTFTDFEFIIVDDCSSDTSSNIIMSYDDPRIKFFSNKNNIGQTKSLNKGISLATGKYIARIDQDDLYKKSHLSKKIKIVSKFNFDVIGNWSFGINQKNKIIKRIEHPLENQQIKDSLIISQPFTHSALFIKRSSLIKVNKYPENIQISMDYALLVNLAKHDSTFHNIPEYLSFIRYHEKSTSFKNKFKIEKEIFYIQKKTKFFNSKVKIYKAIQFYRILRLCKFLPKNFSEVSKILKNELRLSYAFHFIYILILILFKSNKVIIPTRLTKIQ
jgi:glycosyltransferase involved in cell wall biosynthesis